MKVREILKVLKDDGWQEVRMTGSHRHFRHSTKPGTVSVPGAMSDELATGTLRSIYRQAGLNRE